MSTIAAIATALGCSGINIIRVSGERSLSIISGIFDQAKKLQPNTIQYGKIMDNQEIVDKVLVSYFKAPHSFTGEDICEINCHGGTIVTQQILELVVSQGAVLAEPGEFSKRAFLNGKMDLSEAEGVIDLITSKTRIEKQIASTQMNGRLNTQIDQLRDKLIELLAHMEVNIDYPEYDEEVVTKENIQEILTQEINEIEKLLFSYEEGRYIKNGIRVAILGKPNVGKSSLLNKMANYERAIVTDIAGTTRDIVEETINLGDVILMVSDTAGIRETEDIIEKIGVSKSIQKLEEVDLVLYLLDVQSGFTKEDREVLSKIQNKGIKCITVINKVDKYDKLIFDAFMDELAQNGIEDGIAISVNENIGLDKLKEKILSLFFTDTLQHTNETVIVRKRHKDLLQKAVLHLKNAYEEIEKIDSIDIISIPIKESSKLLGEMIGKDVSMDIVTKIFEKFCLGK